MNKLIEVNGDLVEMWLNKEIDVGFQQNNCFNTFGKGLALQVKQKIPGAYEMDQLTTVGDRKKLGQFTVFEKNNQMFFNLYGQYKYGKATDKIQFTDYDALFDAMVHSCQYLIKSSYNGKKLGFPHGLGAGLGGGDFTKILSMIKYVFGEYDFQIYIVKKLS